MGLSALHTLALAGNRSRAARNFATTMLLSSSDDPQNLTNHHRLGVTAFV
jgi:hypothetical protein